MRRRLVFVVAMLAIGTALGLPGRQKHGTPHHKRDVEKSSASDAREYVKQLLDKKEHTQGTIGAQVLVAQVGVDEHVVAPEDVPKALVIERVEQDVPGFRKTAHKGCRNLDSIRIRTDTNMDVSQCAERCNRNNICVGFQYGLLYEADRTCTMLSGYCEVYDDTSYNQYLDRLRVSGYSKLAYQDCSNMAEVKLSEGSEDNPTHCARYCDEDAACVGFTYVFEGESKGKCQLYKERCTGVDASNTHHFYKPWKIVPENNDCVDKNDEVATLASSRGYAEISSCGMLIARWLSEGRDCSSGLQLFGEPEKTVQSMCCQSCSHPCMDHDSVIAAVMTRKGYPDYDTCEKAVPNLREMGLRRDLEISPQDLPGITISDVCCRSCSNPALAWKVPLGETYEGDWGVEDLNKNQFATSGDAHTEGQFERMSDEQSQADAKNLALMVGIVKNQKSLERLRVQHEALQNVSLKLDDIHPLITIGNTTLTREETTEFGRGYTEGFTGGYEHGFKLAMDDDMKIPLNNEMDRIPLLMANVSDPSNSSQAYAAVRRNETSEGIGQTVLWQSEQGEAIPHPMYAQTFAAAMQALRTSPQLDNLLDNLETHHTHPHSHHHRPHSEKPHSKVSKQGP